MTEEAYFCEYEDYLPTEVESALGVGDLGAGCITYPASVTTERAECHYGQPVVVIDGEARGPFAMPPGDLQVFSSDLAERLYELGYAVVAVEDKAAWLREYSRGVDVEGYHWHPDARFVRF